MTEPMTCEEVRELVHRDAAGGTIDLPVREAMDEHLATCSWCRTEQAFAGELAASIREAPAVEPSARFVDALMAQLPPPVMLPAPSFRALWTRLGGLIAAAAGAAGVLWEFRAFWLGWAEVATPMPSARLQWNFLADLANRAAAALPVSPLLLIILLFLAATTWGVKTLVEEPA